MTNDGAGARIKHPKLRGEWAELCFMVRAAEKGLQVSKPWGETARYDFAVERDGHFARVQVKSTMFRDRGGYSCTVRGCRGPYVGDPFDFVAAYLIPEDLWYIIPEEVIRGQGSIAVYPRLKKSKYGRYREAWHLLGAAGRVIQACAERVEGHPRPSEAWTGHPDARLLCVMANGLSRYRRPPWKLLP
jgi:PD-(D/E)XK endonuclease